MFFRKVKAKILLGKTQVNWSFFQLIRLQKVAKAHILAKHHRLTELIFKQYKVNPTKDIKVEGC